MNDRFFNETDLREMLEIATGYRPSDEPGRFTVDTRHSGRPWEIIVEPDPHNKLLKVITGYWVGPIPNWRR